MSSFDADKTLLRLSDKDEDAWTIDDATKGISIMGGTGSGKTTASGKTLAHEFLNEGWGGLVLCAKSDEAGLWYEYCKKTNRLKDLIIFGKNSVHTKTSPVPKELVGQKIVFNPI